MTAPGGVTVIDGRVVHKASNALKITFQDGPGDPFAVGVQNAGEGKGKKFGMLLGFKNGGPGRHVVTYTDGSALIVTSRDSQPTLLSRPDGTEFGVVERGDESSAKVGGREVLHFAGDPDEAKSPDLFRIVVTRPSGESLGRLDVIRKAPGWSTMMDLYDAVNDMYIWWDRAGQALPVPILGTRVALMQPATPVEREVLVGACVDIAIGLRPYIAAMS
jgi:hypothetical protein